MVMNEESALLGKVSLEGAETSMSFTCDALAYHPTKFNVLVLSVASAETSIKAMRAALNTKNAKIAIVPTQIPEVNDKLRLASHAEGYDVWCHKLGFNLWHMIALAREPGLLPTLEEAAIWRALMQDNVTTPMLRHWVPEVTKQLRKLTALRMLKCFGCEAGIIEASTETLDLIVTEGIRNRTLTIK